MFLVPQAYAAVEDGTSSGCNTGAADFSLGDCFYLGPDRLVKTFYNSPADLINVFVGAVFLFGGIILFLTIFYAGFKFIKSGTKGKDEAKTMITTALIGFIIMFTAYWIVRIVELITGAEIIF